MTTPSRKKIILSLVILCLLPLLACNFPWLSGLQLTSRNPVSTIAVSPTPLVYEGEEDMVPGEMDTLPESMPEPWQIRTAVNWPLADADIGPEGGTIVVNQPGNPLDGLSITIPPGAYDEIVHFEISSSEITSHNVPSDMTVITPLIDVQNGQSEAKEFLEIHLPRKIAEGRFAMLFTYDPETDFLDALPLVEHDQDGLTALTTHFSKILGIEVNTAELDALKIQTGFKQGRNNWQFANYGSFISPGGHCAGQSLMAMDFFLRYKGAPLYGKYDNYNNTGYPPTPNQQDDDRLGYRLCSVAQETMDWEGRANQIWFGAQRNPGDFITYYSFALALRASHEPQLVGIYDAAGGGHALILYGKYADRFYISDPNYPQPNANRYLSYNRATGKFRPYFSGPTAADLGKPYPTIYYMNKYALINDTIASALWAELDAGTVGKTWFPEYKLDYFKFSPDGSTNVYEIESYSIFVDGPEADIAVDSSTTTRTTVYDQANTKIRDITAFGAETLVITNPLGTPYLFAVYGQIGSDWHWIDGRWITFYRGISGKWHGAACAESESNPYRWEIKLSQDMDGNVIGDVYFHACPGGGAAFYSLSGTQKPGEDWVMLTGNYSGGRGDLGNSAPRQATFTVKLNESPSPNFAP